MAAPANTSAKAGTHPLLRRGRYALPRGVCTNRSEWRLPPRKPAERLSPHYRLECDFGTSLAVSWKNDGAEPIYVCAGHAKELGYSVEVGLDGDSVPRQAGAMMQKEAPATAGPIAGPKKAASAPSKT